MTNQYPWDSNTTPPIASQDDPRYETPGGAANKIEQSLQDSKEYTDESLLAYEAQTMNIADDAVTRPKIAPGAVGANEIDPTILNPISDATVNVRLNQIDEQLAEVTNETDDIISPLNFDTLDLAIAYAKANKKVINAKVISLNKDTSFRGVGLHVGEIKTNGFKVELGGFNTPDLTANPTTNPTQFIEKITPYTSSTGFINVTDQVYIRGAIGQHITINQFYGTVNLRLNETDRSIAYSTFNLGAVYGVSIDNDPGVPSNTPFELWCNENIFNINRCFEFYMNGTYNHDNNRIYGGTFEGNSKIEIVRGYANIFYDMRFEAVTGAHPIIKLYETAGNNIFYCVGSPHYHLTITDNGKNNSIKHLLLHNAKILNRYSIKSDTLDPAKYMGGFKDLVKTTDGKGMKPIDYAVRIVLESEFFDDPKNKMFEMRCTRKSGLGLAVLYKVYDGSFNDVSAAWNAANQSFYFTTTSDTAIANDTEGAYTKPFSQAGNTTTGSAGIYNDKITIFPSNYWNLYKPLINPPTLPEIKYVKFCVIGSSFFGNNSEVYDITASIYDLSSKDNFHYFN
ncbi:hypothetical protein BSK62_13145 [Paenibacillus odorifer]|uniref:hypothetical protein n=1 Tax=Paenibacillus TaxID=44249 RepID=UPI00096D06AA|nr:hypothetical protein [Paenibacillus odorifer]OMD66008.1 hypothetical protein BSK62_13145 [Paenibacillus odorifer]